MLILVEQMYMADRLLHSVKALIPTEVTVAGMVIAVRFLLYLNA